MCVKRIIPCLDIKDGKVVKGVNFVGLKEIGDPIKIAQEYEKQGASEIVFLDITATEEQRKTFTDLVKVGAKVLSIPITVGGGMGSIADIQDVLAAGAKKVSINSAAVRNPQLLNDAVEAFGSSCIVAAIDGRKSEERDGYDVYISGGKVNAQIDLLAWAKQCEERGAGEILLTSMDRDGQKDGYDLEMLKAVKSVVSIPVIASGGCGSIEDIVEVFKQTDCEAALGASLFHYQDATITEVRATLLANNIA